MGNKTFPKENKKKLNEIIRDLKSENRRLQKEVDFLKKEVMNLAKPTRVRKIHQELEPGSVDWKLDFIKRFRRDVLGEKE